MKLTILVKANYESLSLAAGGLVLACLLQSVSSCLLKPHRFSSPKRPPPPLSGSHPPIRPHSSPDSSLAPTQEFHPGVGDLLFSDSFDQPDFGTLPLLHWPAPRVTRNRLVLSITGRDRSPSLSLRSQPDGGRLLRRSHGRRQPVQRQRPVWDGFPRRPGGNYYRFAVNCNGQVRLERGTQR